MAVLLHTFIRSNSATLLVTGYVHETATSLDQVRANLHLSSQVRDQKRMLTHLWHFTFYNLQNCSNDDRRPVCEHRHYAELQSLVVPAIKPAVVALPALQTS